MPESWKERLGQGILVPYFQPIVSVETQSIAAYEALGRQCVGSEVRSLGAFFDAAIHDRSLASLRTEVDRTVRRAALTEFARADHGQRLFLNIAPRMMLDHLVQRPEELPPTLQMIRELGIDPRRVVIELTEEPIGAETSLLKEIIDLYRSFGCAIAVDDVGAEASNLDRIGYFEPDLIKIDSAMLRRALRERSFQQVLRGVGAMAEGLGATLLFEGVETEQELERALELGARYLQGWYFGEAGPGFLEPRVFAERLQRPLVEFGRRRHQERRVSQLRVQDILRRLGTPPRPVLLDGRWVFSLDDLEVWKGLTCRAFVTDADGIQVSPNYEVREGRWVSDAVGLGLCRSIRPYFPAVASVWTVTDVYHDVNDRSSMRTFGICLAGDLHLFVDVLEIETRP